MNRSLSVLVIGVVGWFGLLAPWALAQAPQSVQPVGQPSIQPTVSPYLGLGQNGVNPAIDYYNRVLPQLSYNAAIPGLQGQIGANQQAINQVQYGVGYLETGHPTRFMNLGGYFMNINGGVGNRGANAFAPGYRTVAQGQGFNGNIGANGAYGPGYGAGAYGGGYGAYGAGPYGAYGTAAPGYGSGYGGGYFGSTGR
jgi:hypothetical protein